METLLMVLVICVFVKAVENSHHPKFVSAFDEDEWPKTRQAEYQVVKVPCNSSMDAERHTLVAEAQCGVPQLKYHEFKNVPRASWEEIYPVAVWVKRCIGMCDNPAPITKCQATKMITRQIPIRVVNMQTSKESCSYIPLREHISCQCSNECRIGADDCKKVGKVYNNRVCGCQCPDLAKRRDCLTKKNQNMKWSPASCECVLKRSNRNEI